MDLLIQARVKSAKQPRWGVLYEKDSFEQAQLVKSQASIIIMPKVKLVFCIFGEAWKPKEFDELLKLKPSKYWHKGDFVPNRSNLQRKETAWELIISTNGLSLDEVLSAFKESLAEKISMISSFIKDKKLESKLEIVLYYEKHESLGFYLDKETIEICHLLNGSIDLDVYQDD